MNQKKHYEIYINGEWTKAETGEIFSRYNPANGELVATFEKCGPNDVNRAVLAARSAFDNGEWPHWSAGRERSVVLRRIASLIEERSEDLAYKESAETGALIGLCRMMMGWSVEIFNYFAGIAETAMAGRYYDFSPSRLGFVVRQPLGVAVLIGPWNFPLSEMVWKVAPALAAGCTIIAKPPSLTPITILELASILEDAGVPKGVYNVVTGPGNSVGQALVEHSDVDKVSLTGDNTTGKKIIQTSAEDIKRVTMELGGKSAHIVFADANLDEALPSVIGGIFNRSGQVCIAGSRLLVEDSIHDLFVDQLIAAAEEYRVGNPLDPNTQMGPMISESQLTSVLQYISKGVKEGARLRTGGKRLSGSQYSKGWYIEPTIFSHVQPSMMIAQEEIFGPVLSVMKFKNEEEAIDIANHSRFGLAGGVWTNDLARALKVARRIHAGTFWINQYGTIEYEMPFGGFKESGYGRELGIEGIQDYTELKSIHVRHSNL